MKIATGRSSLAMAATKLWNARLKRICASIGGSSGTTGCSPTISSQHAVAEAFHLAGRRREHLTHQRRERLDERAVRRVPAELVELPPHEVPAAAADRLVHLVHERRLADAGVSADEEELGGARRDAVERLQQLLLLLLTAVQPLGDLQALRHVPLSGPQRGRSAAAQVGQTVGEIPTQPEGALVAVLRTLLQQLQDDARDGLGNGRIDLVGRTRRARQMLVDHVERVVALERQLPGHHLVERDPERVQVGAVVHRAIGPAGLLGGHVRERDARRRLAAELAALAGNLRRGAEPRQARGQRAERDEQRAGLHVAMHDLGAVDLAQDRRRRVADLQRRREVQAAAVEQAAERLPLEVLEHDRQGARGALERDRAQDAVGLQRAGHLELVTQRGHVLALGQIVPQGAHEHRSVPVVTTRTEQDRGRSLVDPRPERVPRNRSHEPLPP
jgi:hypothetical protein